MQKYMIYIVVVVAIFLFFMYQSVSYRKKAKVAMEKDIKNRFGKRVSPKNNEKNIERISKYFQIVKGENDIDDITWNDFDMDLIFYEMNNTKSSIGEDCLYRRLKKTDYTEDELEEFDRVVKVFENNPEFGMNMEMCMADIGKTKTISVYEVVHRIKDIEQKSSISHIILAVLLLLAFGSLFIFPPAGIVAIIIMVITNVMTYYKSKDQIGDYFVCFGYLMSELKNAMKIAKMDNKDISRYNADILDIYEKLGDLKKGVFVLATNNMSGSIGDIVLEYVRMLFHVDIIKFNSMAKKAKDHIEHIDRLYEILGFLESAYAVASYRTFLKTQYNEWTSPEFLEDSDKLQIKAVDIYHPLIEKPVKNSIEEYKGVLITGSNASGKSTFLKTIGINYILSQSVYTCTAKEFKIHRCDVYSSMSLRDNIKNSESYYMVEIKAIKRIMDAAASGKSICCFVDEVLRGTNTVERISASSQILKSFSCNTNRVQCFAATHDIELTFILQEIYSNYHFSEQVEGNDVLFNYLLIKGRATTRNAILLLKAMGYDENIVENAKSMAEKFISTGKYI